MRLIMSALGALLLFISMPAISKVNVFACEPEWKSLVETLGGQHVKAYSATSAFQDPHYIEARPSLIAKTRRADLVLCTGAELEIGWLPLLLRQSGNASIQKNELGFFLAAEQVDRIEVPTQVDRSQGDVHASGNPHVHWDPYRLIKIAEALSDRLQMIDVENAADYKQRYINFESKWKEHIAAWEALAKPLAGKSVIVYHKNWSYLLNWLQINVVGDIEPKPGLPPTSSHLASLLKLTRSTKVDYILVANYQDDKGARWLSGKTGIPIKVLPFTVGGDEQSIDLASLYEGVIENLAR